MSRGPEKTLDARQLEALRDIKRVCHAGLDSITLREEVQRRAARVIPVDAYTLATCDPETGLMDHALGAGVPETLRLAFLEHFYPDEVLGARDALARGDLLTRAEYFGMDELCREADLAPGIHLSLAAEGTVWGSWCMMRERNSVPFGESDFAFLRAVAPHFTRGVRMGRLVDAARFRDSLLELPDQSREERPALVVLDAAGRPLLRSANAWTILADIGDLGFDQGEVLPSALVGAAARLRARHAAAGDTDPSDLNVGLRTRGRSGCWYSLRASLTEPDAHGRSATLVVLQVIGRGELASILTALYGLTPRECEVLKRAAAGESTRRIALGLGISVYTVQDHLDHACEKVGVRGRRALVAKIFLDGYLETVTRAC